MGIPSVAVGTIRSGAAGGYGAAERLAEALRFQTISGDDRATVDRGAFLGLHALLKESFPRVHRWLRREVVGELSLLYTWQGTDATLAPILLSAHMDVVPVAPASEGRWSHAPFDGRIANGFVWGRGALDDKPAVLGVLEAIERLLVEGFGPARTVYLAFGHDEERGGADGAARIAALLRSRNVTLDHVLDEGLVVGDGLIPGVERPVAMIGVAEKGRLVLELIARAADGHASMPPARGAIGTLALAVARLEAQPMAAGLRSPIRELFACVAPEMSPVRRVIFTHLGIFGPLVTRLLARSHTTNAAVRTTMAVTTAAAGGKDNMLPSEARAVLDARILPGDDVGAVVDHVRRVVDDPAIEVRVRSALEASPIASTTGPGFRTLSATIRDVFPRAIVAPGLVVAGTDARHYAPLSRAVYRFRPLQLTGEDLGRIHGVNERIGVEDYARLVGFYTELFRASTVHGPCA